MEHRNIIVIGASAGGFHAIQEVVRMLPAGLQAALFVVWHMSPDMHGILPDVLNRLNTLPSSNAVDEEPICLGHVYIAPPDRHLLIEKDRVRVTHGPKENRFRPAVDPLFRSAAYAFGNRVIGVVLSGALDDGSAGIWTIKEHGGLAVVQDPLDAEVSAMPKNALLAVKADYRLPVSEIGALLVRLVHEPLTATNAKDMQEQEKEKREVNIALGREPLAENIMGFGELSPYTCPECHGVLTRLQEGSLVRFRCHTGHAYSVDSLLAALSENIEENLWTAIRSMQESIILLNHMGDHYAEANFPTLAAAFFKKRQDAEERAVQVRRVVCTHEQLTTDGLREQAGENNG
jgi:two-component system chemotaxis response regulator CheB